MPGTGAAVQWEERQMAARSRGDTMHHVRTPKSADAASRRQRTSLDPYMLDEVTFTLSEIRRARGECEPATRN
jgi:hypothetical protein